ncbi:hypothetical protein KIH27_04215 [Mycobacterium sp. M1]|uniref:Translation initiation factor IF-2 n=1 Tax=Mycolicibacter acidiphilus TaxID=2835306 RepID=A0ABS5RH55_9MYCO|nr:hypothetical protein [Mycolicibacter acidiphilus]MBS9532791.1 hypothetical protein [Mycolicibacter acidiphilus]
MPKPSELMAQGAELGRTVGAAANRYAETDQTLSQRLTPSQFDENGNPVIGSGTNPASQAGQSGMGGMEQMGQMMQMPMQMAQQMGQMPMSMMGMVGQAPQMAMQAAQQFGKMGGGAGKMGGDPKDALGDPPGGIPGEPPHDDKPADDKPDDQGAAGPDEAKPQSAPAPVQQGGAPAERMEPIPVQPDAPSSAPVGPTTSPDQPKPFRSIDL